MKLSKIKPNPNNPRLIKDDKFEALKKSIQQSTAFGKLNPITIDVDNRIIAGNMRYKAAKDLGLKDYPVQVLTKEIYEQIIEDRKEKGLKGTDATYDDICNEWIIKDNLGYGHDDWTVLKEWDQGDLTEWGVDVVDFGKSKELGKVNSDEEEWIGMPDFEAKDDSYKIIIHFANEKTRNKYANDNKMKFTKRESRAWSTNYPFEGRDDLSSVEFE